MKIPTISSKRKFTIKIFTGIKQTEEIITTLSSILGFNPFSDIQGTELQYSLQDDIDYILDLKVGEHIILNQSRDGDLKDKCLVTRIQ